MDMSRYRELFLSETREHLNRIGELLVALEQEPSGRETMDALFREAHSVKGMAASLGYEQTAALRHHLEEYPDGFAVVADRRLPGGMADAVGDHRLAMAFAVAALGAAGESRILGSHAVDVSYPGFFDALEELCR